MMQGISAPKALRLLDSAQAHSVHSATEPVFQALFFYLVLMWLSLWLLPVLSWLLCVSLLFWSLSLLFLMKLLL